MVATLNVDIGLFITLGLFALEHSITTFFSVISPHLHYVVPICITTFVMYVVYFFKYKLPEAQTSKFEEEVLPSNGWVIRSEFPFLFHLQHELAQEDEEQVDVVVDNPQVVRMTTYRGQYTSFISSLTTRFNFIVDSHEQRDKKAEIYNNVVNEASIEIFTAMSGFLAYYFGRDATNYYVVQFCSHLYSYDSRETKITRGSSAHFPVNMSIVEKCRKSLYTRALRFAELYRYQGMHPSLMYVRLSRDIISPVIEYLKCNEPNLENAHQRGTILVCVNSLASSLGMQIPNQAFEAWTINNDQLFVKDKDWIIKYSLFRWILSNFSTKVGVWIPAKTVCPEIFQLDQKSV